MKKIISIIILTAIFVILNLPNNTFAESALIIVDGGKLVEGTTLVPLRVISEGLGAKVQWDGKKNTITVTTLDKEIVLTVNSRQVQTGDLYNRTYLIPYPTQIQDGKTFVPLRAISELFGAKVDWDGKKSQVLISIENKQIIVNVKEVNSNSVLKPNLISKQEISILLKKVDEAQDVSSMKQIGMHFEPYFSKDLINQIVKDGGLKKSVQMYDADYKKYYPILRDMAYGVDYFMDDRVTISKVIYNNGYMYPAMRINMMKIGNQWKVLNVNIGFDRDSQVNG